MQLIEKVKIEKYAFPLDGRYHYNAMIWRSVDGGETFWYCGCGKYYRTLEEAEAYKAEVEAHKL